MKSSAHAQSATSLPRAPRDDVSARSVRYLITMGIRIACFVLMVVITPYGWYTWVLGAAAILLPYVAVVFANVGSDGPAPTVQNPERALPATPAPSADEGTRVIRLDEALPLDPPRERESPE